MSGGDPTDDRPWDARLVAWMSRGSDRAGGGGRESTPRQRVGYLLLWVGYCIVWLATGSIPWWFAAAFIATLAMAELIRWLRRRRR
jgi:hypothetical protein